MPDDVQDLYDTGLTNARAAASRAVEALARQVGRLEGHPEMAAGLRRHIAESEQQRDRLDGILESRGRSASALRAAVAGVLGSIAAVAHAPLRDEVLADALANHAEAHHRAGAYRSLIVLAELAGDAAAAPGLRESLAEAERMAAWVAGQIEPVTRACAARAAGGAQAGGTEAGGQAGA